MNKKARDRWIQALRSGDFAQGFNKLKTQAGYQSGGPAYCCLGVLLEIEKPGLLKPKQNGVFHYHFGDFTRGPNEGTLNNELREEFGLSQIQCGNLMNKNDEGQSFSAIADWIEETIPIVDGENE